jgi:hypothetical protein
MSDVFVPIPSRHSVEPMVDGRHAAEAFQLPCYWFTDRALRARYRIPHYLLGGLVRYRLSELTAWAERHQAPLRRSVDDTPEFNRRGL